MEEDLDERVGGLLRRQRRRRPEEPARRQRRRLQLRAAAVDSHRLRRKPLQAKVDLRTEGDSFISQVSVSFPK